MPSGGLAGKSTAHNFAQKYAIACVGAIEALSKRIGILFDSALVIITAPATWLHSPILRAVGKLELASSGPKRAVRWVQLQLLRLLFLIIYWPPAGSLLLLALICFIFVAAGVFQLFSWTGWVGGIWALAIFIWLMLADTEKLAELDKVAFVTAIGVTPQFLFLCAQNGFIDNQMEPPAILQAMIHGYEFIAVWMYTQLEPIRHIAWHWWALAIVSVLLLAYVLDNSKLLSRAFALRSALASLLFLITITSSVSLSAAIPVSNWEPDIQARLKARLADEVRYETKLNLAVEMQRWFDTHRAVPNVLPIYSQNFDDALKQLGHDVNGSRRPPNDVLKATLAAMRDLVPNDLADTIDQGGTSSSREEQKVSGDVAELLRLEGAMKHRNVVLRQRADQAREGAVNFIAQVVEVSVPLKPFLSAIVNEVINASAEVLSKRILERVPIEEAVKKSEQLSSDVRTKNRERDRSSCD